LATWTVILLVLGALSFALMTATRPQPLAEADLTPRSHFIVINAHYRELGPEGIRLEATAERSRYEEKTNQAAAQRLRGIVHHEGHVTHLTARAAVYDIDAATASLSGGVRIVNEQGYSLATTAAVLHHKAGIIETEEMFEAEGQGITLTGTGLRYDLHADTFTVERNVGASIRGGVPL
jgi:LPS export ABC transporter protein LptC